MSVEAIMNEVQTLSRDEQLELQHRLDEHLSEEPSEVREMLRERIRLADENPNDFVDWEEIRDESLARIRR